MDTSKERDELTGVEGQGQSNPDTSLPEGSQSSSQGTLDVAQLLADPTASELIDKMVDERVSKAFQSNKDKRLQKVDDNASRLDKIENKMEGNGMDYQTAKAEVLQEERDAKIDAALQSLETETVGSGDTQTDWTARETAILSGRVDVNDPELRRFRNEFEDINEYLQALPNKVWQMQTRVQGDASGVAGGTGSAVDVDLKAEYDAELAALDKPIRPHVLADVKAKYRKKGLQIY